jgi:hypothetical protein
MFRSLAAGVFALIICSISISAKVTQRRPVRDVTTCPKPVYSSQEVTRRAKITAGPDLRVAGVDPNFVGRVAVEAVLCRTGRVTDIVVSEASSPMVKEFVGLAVSQVQFLPAEVNWHTVSQKIRFEFEINKGEVKGITISQTNGRPVESIDVMGNRRFMAKQILGWIRTRAGEPYDEIQVKRDFDAILSTGYFDKLSSRVFIEDGLRGGVAVYFEVVELPVINEVAFEGLKIDPAIVKEAWKAAHISLDKGGAYSPDTGKAAIRVIKQVLDQRALGYSKVDVLGEMLNSQTINLTFVITDR